MRTDVRTSIRRHAVVRRRVAASVQAAVHAAMAEVVLPVPRVVAVRPEEDNVY